jgi:uncharacterized protein
VRDLLGGLARVGLVVAICLGVRGGTAVFAQFPAPAGYVNDFGGALDESAEEYLETYLGALERNTSAEVVVVTVVSLDGATIEDYASRLFAAWGIGKAQSDNGVLLLVAPRDRRVRIEVGYGLEAILPDGLAGEIIRNEIIPEFSAGNISRGIGRGLDRIARVVRRDPSAVSQAARDSGATGIPPAVFTVPFFGVFAAVGGFLAGLGIRTKTYGPVIAGGMFSGIPLLIAVSTFGSYWLLFLLPLELIALARGYWTGRSPYWISMLRKGTPSYGGRQLVADGWTMGGVESSGSGSSFDGGDGSSSGSSDFGGGSSGGGGASGRW